ncbi:MAG TPA: VWA domain-containing protein [Terriglobia bacterium]|nr:VWA domain-containing protein [Terriglobia bacterium]
MKKPRSRQIVGLSVTTVTLLGLLIPVRQELARYHQDQQPQPAQDQQSSPSSPGPATQPGETVLVPKKTQPAPGTPATAVPEEKKPEKINPKQIYAISTTTNLVSLDVLVTDKDGNPIPSLTKTNFKVYDDGVEQALSNFGTGDAPMTVCLLIEFSSRSWVHLYLALEDVYSFLGTMRHDDWVAVVEYDMQTHILTDFTQDRSTVRAALDTLRIPGFQEANLFDALAFTIDRMKNIEGRKAIIAIVGGAGNRMLGLNGIDTFSKITYPEMLKIAKASETPIYAVSTVEWENVRGMASDMTDIQAKTELTYITQNSGGQAFFPRFEAEFPEEFQQIAGQMRTQYSLGFIPSNSAKDGKYHKLAVKLVDADGSPLRITNEKGKAVKYKIIARDGYYAPKS